MFSCPVSVPRSSRRAVSGTLWRSALASKFRDGVPPKSPHRPAATGILDLTLTMHPHTQHRREAVRSRQA